jgi:hypothetical protein
MADKRTTRRHFLGVGLGSGIGLSALTSRSAAQPGAAPQSKQPPSRNQVGPGLVVSKTYPGTTAQLVIKDPARFKIMQLADTHMLQERDHYLSRDLRSVDEWRKMVDLYRPDVLVSTGDFWHNYKRRPWDEGMEQTVAWVESLGVPWFFAWGNHDRLNDYVRGHDRLHDAKRSLYRGGPSQGNYTIDVQGPDGRSVWELIALNTHTDGLTGPPFDWLTEQIKNRRNPARERVPGFAFFHIPIPQYFTIRDDPRTAGIMYEEPGRQWRMPRNADDTAVRALEELGTVKACFCGHLHKQDYSGFYDGIELVFGRSSGWTCAGWVEVRKGAKLITVNCETGEYRWETVFPEGLRWRPKPGEKIRQVVDAPWMQDPLLLYQGIPPRGNETAELDIARAIVAA